MQKIQYVAIPQESGIARPARPPGGRAPGMGRVQPKVVGTSSVHPC